MLAPMVSHTHTRRTTSLVPSSSRSNIHRWLGGIPQTGSWPGLSTAPGQPERPRSASCPASFPYRRTAYIVSEQPPDDIPSTVSPTSHDSDDGSSAAESDTVHAPSCTVSALSWPPGRPWASWSPPFSSSSSNDPDDPEEPEDPDDPDHNLPQQPPPAPEARPQSHPLRFTDLGDDPHVYRDFRSPWRAWQRERNEKEKYHGFRVVHRRQLHPPEDEPLSARDKRALYKLAQQGSRPFDNHHHRRHIDNVYRPPLSRKAVDRRRKHVDKVRGTLGHRVDRRREERKYRKAVFEAAIEDFRPRRWPKNRRRRGQLLLTPSQV